MDGSRVALVIANAEYTDPGLSRLTAPASDATALAEVLGDPEVGGFDVRVLENESAQQIRFAVEDFFADRSPEDLLLLHFSCHGLKNAAGELFLAVADTKPTRLASTAVAADFVNRQMADSRAQRIALFLDCCYGGAFPRGLVVRAAGEAQVRDAFAGQDGVGGGRGRVVVTASSAMEYAFEGGQLASAGTPKPSVFTSAVVDGLKSGDADKDGDGWVGLTELVGYVTDQVHRITPNQNPQMWTFGSQGELLIARSHRITPRALAPELLEAMASPLPAARFGVVDYLRERLTSEDQGLAYAAYQALTQMTTDDSRKVSDAASRALATAPPGLQDLVRGSAKLNAPDQPATEPNAAPPATPPSYAAQQHTTPQRNQKRLPAAPARPQPKPAPFRQPDPAPEPATPDRVAPEAPERPAPEAANRVAPEQLALEVPDGVGPKATTAFPGRVAHEPAAVESAPAASPPEAVAPEGVAPAAVASEVPDRGAPEEVERVALEGVGAEVPGRVASERGVAGSIARPVAAAPVVPGAVSGRESVSARPGSGLGAVVPWWVVVVLVVGGVLLVIVNWPGGVQSRRVWSDDSDSGWRTFRSWGDPEMVASVVVLGAGLVGRWAGRWSLVLLGVALGCTGSIGEDGLLILAGGLADEETAEWLMAGLIVFVLTVVLLVTLKPPRPVLRPVPPTSAALVVAGGIVLVISAMIKHSDGISFLTVTKWALLEPVVTVALGWLAIAATDLRARLWLTATTITYALISMVAVVPALTEGGSVAALLTGLLGNLLVITGVATRRPKPLPT
ncbi:caspase family protein [Kribbella sp. NPDC051620]|uniref:caspase, EACC1-associated type n=1 Tax=Kribbella sp. NPDC051620 TaxID=3364120 RepID=UPI0037AEB799